MINIQNQIQPILITYTMANTEYRTVNPPWLIDHTLHLCMHAALTVGLSLTIQLAKIHEVDWFKDYRWMLMKIRVWRGGRGGLEKIKKKCLYWKRKMWHNSKCNANSMKRDIFMFFFKKLIKVNKSFKNFLSRTPPPPPSHWKFLDAPLMILHWTCWNALSIQQY